MSSASMSETERQNFLAGVHVGVMAVERDGRAPLAVPIWYLYEPGGLLTILIGPDSLKAKLLASSGRFSLCAQTEQVPYQYVMVEGPIVETRQCDVERDARTIARRYLGKDMGDQFIEDGDDSNMICVSMRPETWYSVDYEKAG
jgi:nitroimidazol reductase NimA-like FMN-containing flavoprotein (pyridoxamine 5'-phosphate oxidase superfamily)